MVRPGDVISAGDISVQACRVSRSTNLSIPWNTDTVIGFTTEDYDTDGMHDNVTNNSRITINTAGIYTLSFGGEMAGIGTGTDYGRLYAYIRANGSTTIAYEQQNPIDAASSMPQRITLSTLYQFDAGEYVEAVIFQTNDSSVARFLLPLSDYSPVFAAARIGS